MQISRAAFKRAMVVGSKWTLKSQAIRIRSNLGHSVLPDNDNQRTITTVKTKNVVFTRGDGRFFYLNFEKGDTYEEDNGVLKITDLRRHTLEYHPNV